MKRIRRIKFVIAFVGMAAIGYLLLQQIPTASMQERMPDQVGNDLAKRPPQVLEYYAKLLEKRTKQGNAVIMVRFAKEDRVPSRVMLDRDGRKLEINDEGVKGDMKAGDGIHSAIDTVDLRQIENRQKSLIAQKALNLPVFRGRELVAVNKLDRSKIAVRPGSIINLLPAGNPANVNTDRSLMITDPGVTQDPTRTRTTCQTGSMGKWSFGYLMEQMANTPVSGITPEQFAIKWLKEWKVAQTVNNFSVPARTIDQVINAWPKLADGRLDLSKAPMRLLAIVNRFDLRGSFGYGGAGSNAGEMRFVFAVLDANCNPLRFTVIFEYGVKRSGCSQAKAWAQSWKNLDALVPGSAPYNAALEAITEQIVKANSNPAKPNGSALNQLRTNEIAIGNPWELREFQIQSGLLEQVTVKQTPDISFNSTVTLRDYIIGSQADILADKHVVPLDFPSFGNEFLGGASPVQGVWNAAGISDLNARHKFSLATCSACHQGETQTGFTHINPTGFGNTAATLSGFLRGNTPPTNDAPDPFNVTDPVNSANRQFNDLVRRATDLDAFLNTPCRDVFAIKPLLMTH